jgi:hypothetical protein
MVAVWRSKQASARFEAAEHVELGYGGFHGRDEALNVTQENFSRRR